MAQEVFSLIRDPGNFVLILDNFSIIKGYMNYSCDMAGIIKVIRTPCGFFYHNLLHPLNNLTKESVLKNGCVYGEDVLHYIFPFLKMVEDVDDEHMTHYGPIIPLLGIYPMEMHIYNFTKRFVLNCSQQQYS